MVIVPGGRVKQKLGHHGSAAVSGRHEPQRSRRTSRN